MSSTIFGWFNENWKTLALVAVGAVCLFVLRGMVRSSVPDTPESTVIQTPIDTPSIPVDEEESEESQAAPVLQRRSPTSGGNA